MGMVLPHYKTSHKYGVLRFTLPPELAAMIVQYKAKARKWLAVGDHSYLFVNADGAHVSESVLSTWFNRVMRRLGGMDIRPHALREIFISERRSQGAVAGPSDEAAAAGMTNSTTAWNRFYDPDMHRRLVQQGVQVMSSWRANVEAAGPLADAVPPPFFPDVGALGLEPE